MQVPGRPNTDELKAMALRQQQQIDAQHQLLAAKEQRLRFLKAQEVRGTTAVAEGERLRRLRERVEAQESKLRRLRALRGQADLQKSYNVTLSKFFLFSNLLLLLLLLFDGSGGGVVHFSRRPFLWVVYVRFLFLASFT